MQKQVGKTHELWGPSIMDGWVSGLRFGSWAGPGESAWEPRRPCCSIVLQRRAPISCQTQTFHPTLSHVLNCPPPPSCQTLQPQLQAPQPTRVCRAAGRTQQVNLKAFARAHKLVYEKAERLLDQIKSEASNSKPNPLCSWAEAQALTPTNPTSQTSPGLCMYHTLCCIHVEVLSDFRMVHLRPLPLKSPMWMLGCKHSTCCA